MPGRARGEVGNRKVHDLRRASTHAHEIGIDKRCSVHSASLPSLRIDSPLGVGLKDMPGEGVRLETEIGAVLWKHAR